MSKDKKGFIGEFREFISRGSVIDLAVGVIVGGAFGSITTSLVNDILMPVVSMFLGGLNFEAWKVELPNFFNKAAEEPNTLNFGAFLATVVNFLIIALVIFAIIRQINKLCERAEKNKHEEEEAAPEPPKPTTEELLTEILAELKKGKE